MAVSFITIKGESPSVNAVQQLAINLVTAISKEDVVLEGAYNGLEALAKDFGSLSIEIIPRRLVVILDDSVLSSVQVVVDTLLALLHDVAQSAATLLDTKIHIPIISDLLNKVGDPNISFLDLLC